MIIHLSNNYIAFGIVASAITEETTQTAGDGSPEGMISQAPVLVLSVWPTLHDFKRNRYGRERIDLIQATSAA